MRVHVQHLVVGRFSIYEWCVVINVEPGDLVIQGACFKNSQNGSLLKECVA